MDLSTLPVLRSLTLLLLLWCTVLAQAPGYSKVISHPMDLSTMKSKLDKGKYNAWADIQSDLVLMCTNAKTYNQAGTVVYKQADLLLTYSLKMVKNFKQGKMKVRSV